MSEAEPKVDGVEPGEIDGVKNQESKTEVFSEPSQSVKYETYKRTLNESKKVKSRLEEVEAEKERLKQEILESEGKKDEVIDNLKRRLGETESKLKNAVGTFARTKAYDAIIDEGVKMGVASTKLLKKAVEDKLEELDISDDFEPDREQVQRILTDLRNEEPILFSKVAPKIGSHQIRTDGKKPASEKKLSELSDDELNARLQQSW